MGIYLNPNNDNFRIVLSQDIYVDKTMMLDVLNSFVQKGNTYVCISRPRRFGKTLTQNMIAAFYSKGCDSKDLFHGLNISGVEGYEKNMNRFNVIQIDMNAEYTQAAAMGKPDGVLNRLIRKLENEMRQEFTDISFSADDNFIDMMLQVYIKKKETFIFLIDEYDVLVREQVSESLLIQYRNFLNALFKNNALRPALSLVYITGILPVVRDRVQSKLNNFKEYTILDAKNLAEYIGFTSDEVSGLCQKYHADYAECRLWYDGYRQHGFEIYNPESVTESLSSGYFGDFWGQTSSYQVIKDRISANFEGIRDDVIRMLSGENVSVDAGRFLNTMSHFKTKDDAFTYLIHTGYLAYNLEDQTCRIPNNEIRREWIRALRDDADYKVTDQIISASEQLLNDTWRGDSLSVAKALDASHIHVTSNRSYNNEDALQSAIYLAYIDALNEYTVVKEMTAGKGFADLTYIPVRRGDHPAMIIELKRNRSADTALNQIREKRYFDSLSHYQGNLLFVGISYDENTKTHECKIERFVKDSGSENSH